MSSGGTIPMLTEKPLLFLMDGHALVHRAWHAIQQPLNVSSTGEEVRAVFGFLNTFLRALSDWKPTHCAIAFDLPAPTFRHRQFKEYKAQRPPTPPELRDQFERIKQLVGAFGIPMFENEGYEADDILGTLGRQAEEQEIEALILTGDTDTLQLVSPWVRVLLSYSVQKKTVYDEAAVKERYGGLGPELLPNVKALQGDTSDNIPGVPGVGAKTAIRLINEFGSLEGLYEHLDQVSQAKLQQNLRDNRDLAFQGKALTTIVRDVPVQLDLEDARFWRYDRAKVVELLTELEFFSIVSRIPATTESADTEEPEEATTPDRLETQYDLVDSESSLDELVEELTSAGSFAFDTETTSQHAMAAELVGLSFSTAAGRGWYVPVGHQEGKQMPLQASDGAHRPDSGGQKLRQGRSQRQLRHDGPGQLRCPSAQPGFRHHVGSPRERQEGHRLEGPGSRVLQRGDGAHIRPDRHRQKANHHGSGARRRRSGLRVRRRRLHPEAAGRVRQGAGSQGRQGSVRHG